MSSARFWKVIAGAGVLGGGLYGLKRNEWDVKSVGLIRFGRAAATVALIAGDYKYSTKGFKDNSDESLAVWSQVHKRSSQRLLRLCSVNGGLFIKVGQHIGALDYLVPPEYVQTLRILHSRAPKSSIEDINQVIQEDLGQKPSEIFETFEEEPIGAASLAQVHKATLKDGTTVAVKVQHREVRAHSFIDIVTMELLVKIVDRVFPEFSFLWLAEETKRNLPLELDFVNEAKNAERVSGMLCPKLKWLKIPKIVWNNTTDRVLTMEYVDGGCVSDVNFMKQQKIDVNQLSSRLGEMYSEMIFVHGYVHCDPHPGNILVHKTSKSGFEVVLLDHGLYVTLPSELRINYSKLWMSVINRDIEGIKRSSEALGVGHMYGLLACVITSKPWKSVLKGVDRKINKDEAVADQEELRSHVAIYFPQIAQLLASVPRELLLIFKTNDLIRGIETALGTRGRRDAFVKMSECCVKSIYEEKRQVAGIATKVLLHLSERIALLKIWFAAQFLYACSLLVDRN